MASILNPMACPLCSANAQGGPALVPSGGTRAGMKAVLCPTCTSYLIEIAVIDTISPKIGAALSRKAAAQYKANPNNPLEVTALLVSMLGGP